MNEIQWGEPRPLRHRADVIPFPLIALPPVLRDMAQAISVTTSTDAGMAGTAILSAVGYCFTGMYRLAGKADHTEPPVLYSIIIAQPSERKSPVMNFIKAPFDTFESKYNKDHKEDFYKAQQDIKALEARIKSMEKDDEPDTAAIAKLRVQADNISGTSPIRIAVDDITPESLVIELCNNNTLLMISDEAGMLSNFAGKYSGGVPNLDLLLKAWNGEKYVCDRVVRGRAEIIRPYMSVAIAGQPYIWDNMMNDESFRSSGLLARFFYCFPVSKVGSRRYDTASIEPSVIENYNALIHALLENKFNSTDTEEKFLKFDENAQKNYIDFYNNHIEKIQLTEFANCLDWGGKYHGQILRLCCIIHCVKCALGGFPPETESVSVDTLCKAIAIADYYKQQAIYAFNIGSVNNEILKAEKVLEVIKAKQIKECYQSALLKKCRFSIFNDPDDFYKTLQLLEDYGYVALDERVTGNNKPAVYVYVNPKLSQLDRSFTL